MSLWSDRSRYTVKQEMAFKQAHTLYAHRGANTLLIAHRSWKEICRGFTCFRVCSVTLFTNLQKPHGDTLIWEIECSRLGISLPS